jgi:Cu2+-containing amine oxidase
MQCIDWDSIEKEKNNCPAFTEVIAACEHHGINDIMELKYDCNDEVILQFYSTLYLDEKSSKLFWMTEDEIYSVSLVRFVAILGLKDHTHYPKKLHDDHVMELNRMRFMYEKDEYKLSKVEGFKPFFCAPPAFAEDFVSK